jgi:hypothetical protein
VHGINFQFVGLACFQIPCSHSVDFYSRCATRARPSHPSLPPQRRRPTIQLTRSQGRTASPRRPWRAPRQARRPVHPCSGSAVCWECCTATSGAKLCVLLLLWFEAFFSFPYDCLFFLTWRCRRTPSLMSMAFMRFIMPSWTTILWLWLNVLAPRHLSPPPTTAS